MAAFTSGSSTALFRMRGCWSKSHGTRTYMIYASHVYCVCGLAKLACCRHSHAQDRQDRFHAARHDVRSAPRRG